MIDQVPDLVQRPVVIMMVMMVMSALVSMVVSMVVSVAIVVARHLHVRRGDPRPHHGGHAADASRAL